jgi:hypothetical protein
MNVITTSITIYQGDVNTYQWPVEIRGTTKVTFGGNLVSTADKVIHFIVTDSLNNNVTIDGNNYTVNVTDTVTNHYPGLVASASNNTKVVNVGVTATSGIDTKTNGNVYNGWIGSARFCGTITSCYSTGYIGAFCGGIVGSYAAGASGKTCDITGCYSTSPILGGGGGIVGYNAGDNNGTVSITSCYSTGAISGSNSGGIAGSSFGSNGGTVSITSCYSTGIISGSASGGSVGSVCGFNNGTVTITSCYSTGTISGYYSGGIAGN